MKVLYPLFSQFYTVISIIYIISQYYTALTDFTLLSPLQKQVIIPTYPITHIIDNILPLWI